MKLEMQKKVEEPLLARNRITATVSFENAIPSRQDVIKEIAAKVGSAPELVTVASIKPGFGSHVADVVAYVYKDKETLTRVVHKKMIAKTGFEAPKQEKKEEAPAAEAPKAEGA